MKTVILKNLYQGENSVKMMMRNGEKIYQQLTKFVFVVDKSSIEFPEIGGTDTLTITANEPWTMTLPAWLTASAVSGSGSATITITSQPTQEYLEGDIVITCNGVAKTVNVTAGTRDYSRDYLTIEALEDGNLIYRVSDVSHAQNASYYSVNGGEWVSRPNGETTIAVSSGDKIRFKGAISYNKGDLNVMFSACTLSMNVYGNIQSMFYGDSFEGKTTSTKANSMFNGCSGLTDASNFILPATEPGVARFEQTYLYMFRYCKSLVSGPQILATKLGQSACRAMFDGCTKLKKIVCLATDISAASCTNEWVLNVPSGGTFVKKAGAEWETGANGIPSGWTVIEE